VSAKHPELGESSAAEVAALRLSAEGTATVKKFIAKEVQQRLAAADDGAIARCDKVHQQGIPVMKPGLKKCPKPARQHSCPDGIGWQGVYFDAHWTWRRGYCIQWHKGTDSAWGRLRCEQHTYRCFHRGTGKPGIVRRKRGRSNHVECRQLDGTLIPHRFTMYPYKGFCRDKKYCDKYKGICDENYCDKTGAPQVCQKMQVIHVDNMSRDAGVLAMKRTSCDRDGKCSVFKSGICIKLKVPVWSALINDHWRLDSIVGKNGWRGRKGMKGQIKTFAKRATALLRKYNNRLPSALPRKHNNRRDSDTLGERAGQASGRNRGPRLPSSFLCSGDDAVLGRQAIMNF